MLYANGFIEYSGEFFWLLFKRRCAMANKINHFRTRYAFLLFTVLFFFGCSNNADFSGFLRSTDRVNDRFEQSDEWNKLHPFKTLVVNTDNYRLLVASDLHIGGVKNFNILLDEAQKP